MDNPFFVDIARLAHLLCLVLGMGPVLYFDLRSVQRIAQPMWPTDIAELNNIHRIVSLACLGLWISGATLIWIRTGFDFDTFSPKLWCKIGVVTVLTLNAIVLAVFVIPKLDQSVGLRLIDLPALSLLSMSICAGISLSCWILALSLGASSVLKVADWSLLLPLMFGTSALCIFGVLTLTFAARLLLRKSTPDGYTD